MEEIYAVLLLHKARKEVSEESIKKVLKAVNIDVSDAKIKAVVAALDGVNIDEAIKQAASVATVAPASEVSEVKKVKEKVEEKSEESAAAGLAGLFG